MQTDCATILQPIAQSQLTALSTLPSLNYTDQDFFSMKTRLVQFIQEQFPNDFNDFVESNLGIMLIENWAFLADTLSFKIDQNVNEIFIDTVSEIDNAFRLSNLIGFTPTPPIGATAMFSATIPSVLQTDLSIGSALLLDVSTGGQTISFELFAADSNNNPIFNQPIIIPAGSLSNTSIVGVQGQTVTDTTASNGTPNQAIGTTTSPVLFGSVMVIVDGTQWSEVDFFTDSQSRNEYLVEYTSDWTAYIIFGNGTAGRVPSNGSQIQIQYRVGGGTIGNIISGFIQQQRGVTVPGFGFAVAATFTNYTAASGGYDGDTLQDIRIKLPQYVKTQGRAVTGEDYKVLAQQFVSPYNGQIGKASAVLRNSGCAGNVIDLYVLALDGANGLQTPSDALKAELSEYMEGISMLTDFLCIRDGVVLEVDITLDVIIDKFYRKFQQELQTNITNRVNNFFSLNNWDYGQTLKDTDLVKALSSISEITDTSANFLTNNPDNSGTIVVAQYFEVIRNDNLTINMVFQ